VSGIDYDPWAEVLAEQVNREENEQKTRFISRNGGVSQTEDILLDAAEIDMLMRKMGGKIRPSATEVDRIYLVLGVRFIEWQEVKDVIRVFSTYSKALEFSELCESYSNSYRNIDDTPDIDEREKLIYNLSKIDPAGVMGSQYKRFDIVSYTLY
jgi:hypothetical protein